MKGKIKENTEIYGVISDEGISTQKTFSKDLREIKEIYINLLNPNYNIKIGNYTVKVLNSERKIEGVSGKIGDTSKGVNVNYGVSRGKFFVYYIHCKEGHLGPYKIKGEGDNENITIIPNSEKVYLNNKLLKKNKDYEINYQDAYIVFLPPIFLDEHSKIRVEFEYTEGFYKQRITHLKINYNIFSFEKLEQLDKGDFSKEEKEILKNMDNDSEVIYIETAHYIGKGKGSYKKVGDHFEWEEGGGWDVEFHYVGENNGEYILKNGKYIYVGEKNGDFTTKKQIVPPHKITLNKLSLKNSTQNINYNLSITTSDFLQNYFKNENPQKGIKTNGNISIKKNDFNFSTSFVYKDKNFKHLNESGFFVNNWNLNNRNKNLFAWDGMINYCKNNLEMGLETGFLKESSILNKKLGLGICLNKKIYMNLGTFNIWGTNCLSKDSIKLGYHIKNLLPFCGLTYFTADTIKIFTKILGFEYKKIIKSKIQERIKNSQKKSYLFVFSFDNSFNKLTYSYFSKGEYKHSLISDLNFSFRGIKFNYKKAIVNSFNSENKYEFHFLGKEGEWNYNPFTGEWIYDPENGKYERCEKKNNFKTCIKTKEYLKISYKKNNFSGEGIFSIEQNKEKNEFNPFSQNYYTQNIISNILISYKFYDLILSYHNFKDQTAKEMPILQKIFNLSISYPFKENVTLKNGYTFEENIWFKKNGYETNIYTNLFKHLSSEFFINYYIFKNLKSKIMNLKIELTFSYKYFKISPNLQYNLHHGNTNLWQINFEYPKGFIYSLNIQYSKTINQKNQIILNYKFSYDKLFKKPEHKFNLSTNLIF